MPFRSFSAAVIVLALATAVPLGAQDASPTSQAKEEETNRRFWQAELPGGAYVVGLDRICAVGKHEYIVDGGFVVTEVTIDTVGSVVARFYYGEPFRPDLPTATGQAVSQRVHDVVDTVREKTGISQADRLVIKNYPATTHAKTVEFRLNQKENLEALFQSVNRAWMNGKGMKFSVKSE